MNGIEDMEKMRERVDRFKPREDGSEKDPVHDLAFKEGVMREKIKDNLEQDGINRTVGSGLVNELANDQSTLELETMEAKEQARTDELTKLHNRAAYNEDIPIGLALIYRREQKECGFLFFDLDSFKNINKTLGYSAGDTALKELANLIRNTLRRESDIAYRWGGDEFAVFLPGADLAAAKKIAEEIREKVEEHIFNVTNESKETVELKITVSIGCSSTESDKINRKMESAAILEELESESRIASKAAKSLGKNKIVAFSQELDKKENF